MRLCHLSSCLTLTDVPVRPALTITDNDGQILHGHNGGAWEWTSTELAGHQGYTQSLIYPGYSYDFFDGKHYVVVSRPRPVSAIPADRF